MHMISSMQHTWCLANLMGLLYSCCCIVFRLIAYLPLGDLEGALILANLEKLNDALFVGGKTSDLVDDVANELDALA